MSPKLSITIGLIVGSTAGSYLPFLWGDSSFFSLASIVFTFVGGAIGIWAGYQLSR